MKIIDLSLTIEPNRSEPVAVKIKHISHRAGAKMLGGPVHIDHTAFPDKLGLSLEYVQLTTHTGTHVDAPAHYGPLCNGKPAKSIEELSLTWFYGRGVLLKCHGQTAGPVSREEIVQAVRAVKRPLRPFDIVLIDTNASERWGRPDYFTNFRGVSPEATEWLLKRGVKVIGVDSYSFDPPFKTMLDDYIKTKDPKRLWPAHVLGRKREYCQIERLVHLDRIPKPTGFFVSCFPVKIKGCGAGWSRVVALVP